MEDRQIKLIKQPSNAEQIVRARGKCGRDERGDLDNQSENIDDYIELERCGRRFICKSQRPFAPVCDVGDAEERSKRFIQ
ncbi:MAG: hypothetical protein HY873_00505 [Chloroflexi bacterium]|nr:hypothetical protein [Chloroflexota bacterium]